MLGAVSRRAGLRATRTVYRPLVRAIHWSHGNKAKETTPIPEGGGSEPVVATVFGSFERGESHEDAHIIKSLAPANFRLLEPQNGDDFDFNSLKDVDYLIICTSSMNGFPPMNFAEFAHQLLLASETGDEGCLSHLSHTVWGNGDARWFKTFMSMPRYTDLLLEECGSRRFYARGEYDEPHAPTYSDAIDIETWAPEMWEALRKDAANTDTSAAPVAWDAQWANTPSPRHQNVLEYDMESQLKRYGELAKKPSIFSRPDAVYAQLIDEQRLREKQAEERREAARAERRRLAELQRSAADPK